ncbi:ABC transporter permease subunit [Lentzea sp. BCCO 10_0856]|uniref:ABC transporter permease subunit n=1 Tax=Lentzea miocenica TaxID=3095431 RepID=A0ABU4T1M2_9PSEU|nr:ABC transporter permease subunit [Lentzea sp. BCCO 10_0856]MDX8032062.1 ABC transporter permease subunit [Lentzea sp. BCCO 10_0856]
MTWVVWRQQRAQLITLLAVLVVGAAGVLLLRSSMSSYLDTHGLASCIASGVQPGSTCGLAAQEFQAVWFDRMKIGQLLVLALPALIGLFCGAPLFARELEQGTHVLAFTQSVSRTRWMATKFAVVAAPALVVLVVLQLLVTGWLNAAGKLGPLVSGPFVYSNFGTSGLAPVSYALFTFGLGMLVGALSGRTLAAMAVTLAVFVVVRFVLTGVQQFLLPTQRVVSDDPSQPSVTDQAALVVRSGYLDARGTPVPDGAEDRIGQCGSRGNTEAATDLATCYREQGLAKSFSDIIPSSEVGTLHLVEASIFGGLAVVFVLATGWALRRQT